MSAQDFPAIGFDPAPGRLESVEDLTGKLSTAVTGLDSAYSTLTGISKGGKTWEGEAANAFAEKVGDLPRYLGDSRDALRSAQSQLTTWRSKLGEYQETARRYETEAKAAKEKEKAGEGAHDRATAAYNQAAADPSLRLAGRTYTTEAELNAAQAKIDAAGSRLQQADRDLSAATKQLDAARAEFEDIVKKAEQLLERHQDDARAVAERITKANAKAPPDPGFFEGLADAFTSLGHAIQNWCTQHADLLKRVGDILSAVSGVLAVASLLTMWCPPLSGALALAGGVTALGALGAHGAAKLGGADVGWNTLAMDGVAALPGVKFLAIGATGKVGKAFNVVKTETAVTGGAKFTISRKVVTTLEGGASKLAKQSMLSFARTPLRKVAATLEDLPMRPQEWWHRGAWSGITGSGLAAKIPGIVNPDTPAAGA